MRHYIRTNNKYHTCNITLYPSSKARTNQFNPVYTHKTKLRKPTTEIHFRNIPLNHHLPLLYKRSKPNIRMCARSAPPQRIYRARYNPPSPYYIYPRQLLFSIYGTDRSYIYPRASTDSGVEEEEHQDPPIIICIILYAPSRADGTHKPARRDVGTFSFSPRCAYILNCLSRISARVCARGN